MELKRPLSEHQSNLQEKSRSPIETWLISWVFENYSPNKISRISSSSLFNSFSNWCKKYMADYKCSNIAFSVRLINLKIRGVKKGPHCMQGKTFILDVDELKHTFNIGEIDDFKDDKI